METVVATIKPGYAGLIRSRKKHWEMRKTFPQCGVPFKVLVCESGSGGRITCEFIVDQYRKTPVAPLPNDWVYSEVCVRKSEAYEYAAGKDIYLWHISDVVDYCSTKGRRVLHVSDFGLPRAPQSWVYAKEVPNG